MRLHQSVVEKLILLCTNYGGHVNESKLVGFIDAIRVTPYARSNQDAKETIVLVETQQYLNERIVRNLPTGDVIPMKLHKTVRDKILEIYRTYSGHQHETKLRNSFAKLDFTPYESKTTNEFCIVLLADYMKALRGNPTEQQG